MAVKHDTIVHIRKEGNLMEIYVAEIDGKPIAAFNASTLIKAKEIIENPFLMREDLIFRGLCAEHAVIVLRLASPEEEAEWKKEYGRTIMFEEFGPREGDGEMLGIAFLVEVDEPPDDDGR
jgi:hypothetical protein